MNICRDIGLYNLNGFTELNINLNNYISNGTTEKQNSDNKDCKYDGSDPINSNCNYYLNLKKPNKYATYSSQNINDTNADLRYDYNNYFSSDFQCRDDLINTSDETCKYDINSNNINIGSWIRIDLLKKSIISQIVMKGNENKDGLPFKIKIKCSDEDLTPDKIDDKYFINDQVINIPKNERKGVLIYKKLNPILIGRYVFVIGYEIGENKRCEFDYLSVVSKPAEE